MEELLPKSEWKDCPNCPNQGWFTGGSPKTGPEQVQCEFCYTVPESVFNQEQLLKQYEAEEQARKDEATAIAEAKAKCEARRGRR